MMGAPGMQGFAAPFAVRFIGLNLLKLQIGYAAVVYKHRLGRRAYLTCVAMSTRYPQR